MADVIYDEGSESVIRSEHISPIKTGDNVEAKRVANYGWDGSNWQRQPQQGVVSIVPYAYDYTSYTNTSTTVDTYKYYKGGSGGTLVATVTITYTDTTKNQVSTIART